MYLSVLPATCTEYGGGGVLRFDRPRADVVDFANAAGQATEEGAAMKWIYDDGGRSAAGFRGNTGDCVCRAVAIATGLPYTQVYEALNEAAQIERPRRGRRSHARTGVKRPTIQRYLAELGWRWTPTMGIGTGCRVHLRAEELPGGRLIANCSKHLVAVVDGVIHDTHDPSRDGHRCVYGYWQEPLHVLSSLCVHGSLG